MALKRFDPSSNGWSYIQRPAIYEYENDVLFDENELGQPVAIARTTRTVRTFPLLYRGYDRGAFDYMNGFYLDHLGPAQPFEFEVPELLSPPLSEPSVESVPGGAQPARSISVQFAYLKDGLRTPPSPVATIAIPANELVKVKLPVYPPSVESATIYAVQDNPGFEQQQIDLTEHDRDWTQPDAPLLLATADPVVVNNVTQVVRARFLPGTFKITRQSGLTYEATMTIQELDDGE